MEELEEGSKWWQESKLLSHTLKSEKGRVGSQRQVWEECFQPMVCALGGREGVWVNMSWYKEQGQGQLEREESNVAGDLAKEQCSKKLVFSCVVYSKTLKFPNSAVRGNETLGLEDVRQVGTL